MKTDHAKELFLEQLRKVPVIQISCEKVGMSRATYYRLRASDKNFRRQSEEAMEQGYDMVNDLSEAQTITLIKAGKMPAIMLWLKTHHPRYGSKVKSYAKSVSAEDLTPEEEKIALEALTLASSGSISQNNHEKNNPTISGEGSRESKD